MKFSLDAGGAGAAGQGIGNLFKAFAMGDTYREKAGDESMLNAAKMNAYRATADKNAASAALDQNQLAYQQNPMESAMLNLGLPTGLASVFKQRLETGSFGPSYDAPSDALGGGPQQPAPATPETVAKLGQALSVMQRMYGTGSKIDQGAKAGQIEQNMRGIDAVIANPALAGTYGKANAAAEGKPLFDNVQDTGYSIDNFSGAQTSANPVLAKLFGASSGALTNQRNAAAGNSNANAELDRLRLTTLKNTGALPGTGADAEGALSATILKTLLVPALDDKGRPVRNPLTGEAEKEIDQKGLASFYGWTSANKKRPTATQFSNWEAQGRPSAAGGAAPAPAPAPGADKNPAATTAKPTIKEVPEKKDRQINAVYETPKGPLKWTGTGWVPAK